MFQTCAGLDLSLRNAGVAIITAPLQASYYSFGYGVSSCSTEIDRIDRLIHIANGIMGVLREKEARCVGIENYGFASKGRLAMLGELGGVIKTQLFLAKKRPIVLSANSVRKFLLGKATKDKKEVFKNLLSLGYQRPGNMDESDALAVAHVVSSWANHRAKEEDDYRINIYNMMDFNLKRIKT